MELVCYFIVIVNVFASRVICCSEFKDSGIGRVAQDFDDVIDVIPVNSPMECAKHCDKRATCMSFEYAGRGHGVNVNCTMKELPIALDYFYTLKNNYRYYYKSKFYCSKNFPKL